MPLPALIGVDEFQPAIPRRVDLHQSPPPLHRPASECDKVVLPVEKFTANGEQSLNRLSQPRGQPHALLSRDLVLRNSCTVYDIGDRFLNAYLDTYSEGGGCYSVRSLHCRSYAIFECKRVGVEEGMRKGPQTIEKAKQGAYVARTVSALQKVRRSGGAMGGFIEKSDGTHRFGDYYKLMAEIIASSD